MTASHMPSTREVRRKSSGHRRTWLPSAGCWHWRSPARAPFRIGASGKVQGCQREHGGKPHGDLVQHIADQRCRKDHHTDDHLSIHNVSLSIHVLFLKSSLAARAGSFVDNILTKKFFLLSWPNVCAFCGGGVILRSLLIIFPQTIPLKNPNLFPVRFCQSIFYILVHCANIRPCKIWCSSSNQWLTRRILSVILEVTFWVENLI